MNSTGNRAVDMIGEMHITGNVIPAVWCRRICYANGKPNLNAIMILSNIVYWYRPREVRDEATGCVLRYEKKFRADLLQRNYQDFADQFGLSRKQTKDAFDLLEDIGVIYRELRTIEIKGRAVNNILFIGLNAEKLHEITHGEDKLLPPNNSDPDNGNREQLPSIHKSEEFHDTEAGSLPSSMYTAPSPDVGTNTENTTKTTGIDYSHPIHHGKGNIEPTHPECDIPAERRLDGIDKIAAYRHLIGINIAYEDMLQTFRYSSEKDRFTELYELICDTVCQESGTVRIAGEDKPIAVVKSVFLKLNHEHLMYVMDCLNKTTSRISNMRAYMLTTLYHAPQTMNNCLTQQVHHDMARLAMQPA